MARHHVGAKHTVPRVFKRFYDPVVLGGTKSSLKIHYYGRKSVRIGRRKRNDSLSWGGRDAAAHCFKWAGYSSCSMDPRSNSVIASEAKQSTKHQRNGLLRRGAPRNDDDTPRRCASQRASSSAFRPADSCCVRACEATPGSWQGSGIHDPSGACW